MMASREGALTVQLHTLGALAQPVVQDEVVQQGGSASSGHIGTPGRVRGNNVSMNLGTELHLSQGSRCHLKITTHQLQHAMTVNVLPNRSTHVHAHTAQPSTRVKVCRIDNQWRETKNLHHASNTPTINADMTTTWRIGQPEDVSDEQHRPTRVMAHTGALQRIGPETLPASGGGPPLGLPAPLTTQLGLLTQNDVSIGC